MTIGGLQKFTLNDYPGKAAAVIFTVGCNFRCPYCHNPELVNETVETIYSEEYVFNFLDRRHGLLDGVVITGGEPTLHDDLPGFMKKLKEKGFLVKLDSNGTNPAVLREAIDRKLVDYIAMDIKAPLAKYSATVACPVDVAAIKQSIGIIMSSPVEYEFRTTVVKALLSPQDLEEIGREIKGARRYFLQRFVPTKLLNPQFRKKVTYEDAEFENIRLSLLNYVEHCELR